MERPGASLDPAELQSLDPDELERTLREFVLLALGSVLGAQPGRFDQATNIADLGLDSLMAMELRNRIETEIGVVVPVNILVGDSTLGELAEELTAMVSVAESPERAGQATEGCAEGEI